MFPAPRLLMACDATWRGWHEAVPADPPGPSVQGQRSEREWRPVALSGRETAVLRLGRAPQWPVNTADPEDLWQLAARLPCWSAPGLRA